MFSIIVPIYNVEKYIYECLKSILEQSYNDFEVILVNDGSKDKTLEIIEKFLSENDSSHFHLYTKTNGGLSDARNFGIARANNEYIVFIDSDDYIDKNLLYDLNKEILKCVKIDMIKYPKRRVSEIGKELDKDILHEFHFLTGEEAFKKLRYNKITLETAWTYCINKKYIDKYGFRFAKGRIHEDLGLIPQMLIMAKRVSCIDIDSFYNYRQRENSIMTEKNITSDIKKTDDVIYYYELQKRFIDVHSFCDNDVKKIFIQYYIDAIFLKILMLPRKYRKQYYGFVKKNKLLHNYPVVRIKDWCKKIYFFIRLN